MAEKHLELAPLFDYFGGLLTDKQREYFDYYYNDDLSLSEIAELEGISRQGVRDALVKAEAALRRYEEITGAVAGAEALRRRAAELEAAASRLEAITSGEAKALAAGLAADLRSLGS